MVLVAPRAWGHRGHRGPHASKAKVTSQDPIPLALNTSKMVPNNVYINLLPKHVFLGVLNIKGKGYMTNDGFSIDAKQIPKVGISNTENMAELVPPLGTKRCSHHSSGAAPPTHRGQVLANSHPVAHPASVTFGWSQAVSGLLNLCRICTHVCLPRVSTIESKRI